MAEAHDKVETIVTGVMLHLSLNEAGALRTLIGRTSKNGRIHLATTVIPGYNDDMDDNVVAIWHALDRNK